MAKICVIAQSLGGVTSTGIEVEKIYHHLDSISSESVNFIVYESAIKADNIHILKPEDIQVPYVIKTILFILFKWDLTHTIAKKKLIDFVENIHPINKFIGLSSSVDFYVPKILNILSRYNLPRSEFKLFFFDPLPAKAHWGEHRCLRNSKSRYLSKLLHPSYQFFSASEKMSDYMSSLYGYEFSTKFLLNHAQVCFKPKVSSRLSIAYLGSIYGKRTLGYLPEVLKRSKKWELMLYGDSPISNTKDAIFRHPFVKNIEEISQPDVLLDLDIEVADVYVPGKSYTYLSTEIPILVISPVNSALRDFYEVGNNEIEINEELGVVVVVNHELHLNNVLKLLEDRPFKSISDSRLKLRENRKLNDLRQLFN